CPKFVWRLDGGGSVQPRLRGAGGRPIRGARRQAGGWLQFFRHARGRSRPYTRASPREGCRDAMRSATTQKIIFNANSIIRLLFSVPETCPADPWSMLAPGALNTG